MKNISLSFDTLNELSSLSQHIKMDSLQTLIQVFCAKDEIEEIRTIQKYFQEYYPKSTLIGSTTDGVVKGDIVYVGTKNVVTFTQFDTTVLKSAILRHEDYAKSSFKTAEALAHKIVSDTTQVIISFADGIYTNGEEFAKGISTVAPHVTLSGGLAGDNGKLEKTYVFDKYEIVSSGGVGVSLSSTTLNVSTLYTFDWLPVGKKLQVTKSIKNRVYTIDGLSCVEVYAKYFGYELANNLPRVGIEFPLIFEKDGLTVGRAVLEKHQDGSLTFAGNIPEGSEVRFGIGNVERILQSSSYSVGKMLDGLEYETEAVFVYSCMARRRFMQGQTQDELQILGNLGSVSGFFTYGEFFHHNSGNELLNETMTLLALSEEKKVHRTKVKELAPSAQQYEVKAAQAVANLANRVSEELAELNDNLEQRIEENRNFIYRQAYFDKLTALPNRLSLLESLKKSIGKSIVLVNIDDFTSINDFYGHAIGDALLQKVATALQNVVKESEGVVFKLPSDEYAIIVNLSNKEKKIEEIIEDFLLEIEKQEYVIQNNQINLSVTVSAALINKNRTGLINADMALKAAKKSRKEYVIYREDLFLTQEYAKNLHLVQIIKTAISEDGIIPYFQPLLNLKTGKIDKYEALVRLKQKNGEILSPFAFLEVSEKIKLYPKITEIMIEKSFSYFKESAFSFSINLSFSDILNKKTMQFLFAKIEEYDIASQLTIEILETQENDDTPALSKFTQKIYAHGAKIAIDDFGSGYANFQHMTTIESDFMKIDGSLIKNIDTDDNARLVVETIVSFAKKLGKIVVAEFVHSKEVYDVVKELDIEYAQGYYLGKPLPQTLLK